MTRKTRRPRLIDPPKKDLPPPGQLARASITVKASEESATESWLYSGQEGDTLDETLGRLYLDPAYTAAPSIHKFNGQDTATLRGLMNALSQEANDVNDGNLDRAESMLVTQAHTLDAVFQALLRKAHFNMGAHMDAMETYMRLALKAQSQSRATLETLGQLKNPGQVAFVKQANIANGPQQVNNGVPAIASGAREIEIPQSKLLEDQRGKWLDPAATKTTGQANSALATVGAVNGAAHRKRQGNSESKRLPRRRARID